MSTQRPTFKVVKNGYDRFAVDDAVERLARRVDALMEQTEDDRRQIAQLNAQLNQLSARYKKAEETLAAEKRAADNLTQISLREANEIIQTAQSNADQIIRESLKTARVILSELAELYNEAGDVRDDTKEKLSDLVERLDDISLPRMPDTEWLKAAEDKMR